MAGDGPRRPVPVTIVAVLVALAGLAVLASGVALAVQRDNDLVQVPLLLARLDEALPFDSGQELSGYVLAIGAVVAVLGLVLGALSLGILRGRAAAYVVAVVILGGLAVVDVVARSRATDDLAQLGATALAGSLGLLALLLLALLIGRRSRAWVLGRARGAASDSD